MNSEPSEAYVERFADVLLDRLLPEFPALILVGPRAVGKTTTAGRRAAARVRLDRPAEATAFEADPDGALRDLPEPVLLDEWQAVPEVLGAVRRAVDDDPRPGRFIVTGSVRGEVSREAWPTTGRLLRVVMYPLAMRELLGKLDRPTLVDRLVAGDDIRAGAESPDLRGYVELALRSGFPYPALRLGEQDRAHWIESYLEDLLTHDIHELEPPSTRRRDVGRLRRYLEAYALNSAGVADHKTIYDAAAISSVTAVAYEDLLSRLMLVEQVPAWSSNRLKRLALRPKRYLVEPALVTAVIRADMRTVMRDGNLLGRILESFVAAQLRPELALSTTRPRLHHLRTREGRHEIDLVAEVSERRVVGIEIKAGAPSARDGRHLAWLRDELGDRFAAGVILHTGPRSYELGDRLVAAPISVLWE